MLSLPPNVLHFPGPVPETPDFESSLNHVHLKIYQTMEESNLPTGHLQTEASPA
jgi:hypothetical protein